MRNRRLSKIVKARTKDPGKEKTQSKLEWVLIVILLLILMIVVFSLRKEHIFYSLYSVDKLCTVLRNGNPSERADAAFFLSRKVDEEDVDAISPLMSTLGFYGSVTPMVADLWAGTDTRITTRECVVTALERIGEPVASAVLELFGVVEDLESYSYEVDGRLLVYLKDTGIVDLIINELNNENSMTRQEAALALGKVGDPDAVDPLLLALGHQDPFTRRAAISALWHFDDESLVESLISVLTDPEPGIRSAAARVLGQLGDRRAVEQLSVTASDNDPVTRRDAALALAKIGDPESTGVIIEALRTDYEYWSRAHRQEIETEDPESGAVSVIVYTDVPEIVLGLERMGNAGTSALDEAFSERDLRVIVAAHGYYLRSMSAGSVPVLIESLERFGDEVMAEAFVNSGNSTLMEVAERWLLDNLPDSVSNPTD